VSRRSNRWDPSDLLRRVTKSLALALRAVRALSEADFAPAGPVNNARGGLFGEKLVAETAMLLHCVVPIQALDHRIGELTHEIAAALVLYARCENILAAICLDPGRALDFALPHILLSNIGYPNAAVDDLLETSLAMGDDFGPERLPYRRLEQEWLKRVWSRSSSPSQHTEARILAHSMLGRPLDALGASRFDIYAFSHAVMYTSDFGTRKIRYPRSFRDIQGDATAALAYSLDASDYDLTAEILLTWPMLGLDWNPAAVVAFMRLADAEDKLGFLPGLNFNASEFETLLGDERHRYGLSTSYHTIYVMTFLCAAALQPGRAPPALLPPTRRSPGAGSEILGLLFADHQEPSPIGKLIEMLKPRQQDSVAPLLLAMLLRRAKTKGDLGLLRTALQLALQYDLVDGPAPAQAAALLRRSQFLDQTL
jgi:Domain of unknown function (DUF6895)